MQLSDSGAAEAAAPADDLRADLEAAFSPSDAAPGIGHNGGPEVEHDPSQTERDANGRFVAKAKEPAAEAAEEAPAADKDTDQPEKVEGTEPAAAAPPAIDPPTSWSAADKAHWTKLPREAQETILRRESEVQRGFQQRAEEARSFEPLRQALAPHATRLSQSGRHPADVVKQLLDVHAGLETSPYEVFPAIARMYGVDLSRLAPAMGAQNGSHDGGDNPVVAHLTRTVQQLQDRLRQTEQFQTQQQQTEQAAQFEQARSQFDGFTKRAATDFPHFESVRQDMGRLIERGVCNTLEEAYEHAVWTRPDIRQRIQEDQRKADEAKRADDARKAAAAAKQRAVSVRTNPSTAAPAAVAADSIRAEIERAWAG